MNDETKLRFANALRKLMGDRPLDKISVAEIAHEAGLSRKAFYNHFHDKYDVVNWICYSQFVQMRTEALSHGGWSSFLPFLEFFATDPAFFAEALRDMGQNSLGQYVSDLLYEVVYDSTYAGFKAAIESDKWVELSIAMLVEDARMAVIAWLAETDAPEPAALLEMLMTATEAFCSMMCLERSVRTGSETCARVDSVMSAGWTPELDSIDVHLPAPDDPAARRRAPEHILAKLR